MQMKKIEKPCSKCGKQAHIFLSIDDVMKGLRIEKLIPCCLDCALETKAIDKEAYDAMKKCLPIGVTNGSG